MKTYKTFLAEANVAKLKHLEHITEAILFLGFDGARQAIEILRSLRDSLSGKSNERVKTSLKWDGAPSVIFGIDPSDGQFFVGTKGVFAQHPKLVKSEEDLDEHGYSGPVRDKLSACLQYLPEIMRDDGIYQGDLMFTSGDVSRETIDGKNYLTFTPNTITYAVPEDSNIANDIQNKQVGIVIHTYYEGDSLDNMTARAGEARSDMFQSSNNVWFDDPEIKDLSGNALMTASETMEVTRYLSNAGKTFQQMNKRSVNNLLQAFDELPSSASGAKFQTFMNRLVRSNRIPKPGESRKIAQEYRDYLFDYWDNKVIAKLKSDAGREKKQQFFDEWIKRIDFEVLAQIIEFMSWVDMAKLFILDKYEDGIDSLDTFVWDGSGYKVTKGEGLVVVDKLSGNTWKITDRLEFNRLNFTIPKNWGKGK